MATFLQDLLPKFVCISLLFHARYICLTPHPPCNDIINLKSEHSSKLGSNLNVNIGIFDHRCSGCTATTESRYVETGWTAWSVYAWGRSGVLPHAAQILKRKGQVHGCSHVHIVNYASPFSLWFPSDVEGLKWIICLLWITHEIYLPEAVSLPRILKWLL